MKSIFRDQRGQALVLFALTATFLIMMVGLVVDAGFNFVVRRQLQNSADSAVRAGARYLALGNSDAEISTLITSILAANRCTSPCSATASYITTSGTVVGPVGGGSIPSGTAGVKVTPQKTTTSFLAGLLGPGDIQVSASASAIYGSLGSANCGTMPPMAMNGNTGGGFANFTIGACYLMGDDNGSPGSSSFGWADLNGGGGGASELKGWIDNLAASGNSGCNTTITVGTASANIGTESGTKTSLQTSLLNLINSPYSELTVAIYDTYGTDSGCSNLATSGTTCYHVKGFGRFRLTDVWLTGSSYTSAVPSPDTTPCAQSLFGTTKGVLGQFVAWVDPNGQFSSSAQGPSQVVNIIE